MEWISVNDQKPNIGEEYRYLFLNKAGYVVYGYAHKISEEGTLVIYDTARKIKQIATHWILSLDNAWLPDESKS